VHQPNDNTKVKVAPGIGRSMNKISAASTEPAKLDDLCVNTIRFLSVDAVEKANSGHPGLPMGAAPMAYEQLKTYTTLGGTMRQVGKGMGCEGPSHLLHGHAAELVGRNSKIPRAGRAGAGSRMGAHRDRETHWRRLGISPRVERRARRQLSGIPNLSD